MPKESKSTTVTMNPKSEEYDLSDPKSYMFTGPCPRCGKEFKREKWLLKSSIWNQCNRCWNLSAWLSEEGRPVGRGWLSIISDLDAKLYKIHPDYRIAQIKEKFGTLRYYVDGVSHLGQELIRQAERLSAKTCEECGKPGVLRRGGWLNTLCDEDSKGREPYK